MNARERFHATMRFETPDHVPYFEEGLRDEVLERWRGQGLPADADLSEMFHTDRRERLEINIEPLPAFEQWPTSRRDLDDLRRRLDPTDPARYPDDWQARVEGLRSRDHVVELLVHRGFFLSMGVRDWRRFERVIYMLSDSPALVHEILAIWGEFAVGLIEHVLDQVDIDYAVFSEPIGGRDGPLMSPSMYASFVLASYGPVLDALRARGVETICLVTYANGRLLVPSILKAGFNCLWACEAYVKSMDYLDLRRQFGRDLRLIGGIDLDVLLLDKPAIRREVTTKVPPLLAQGGYIPLADGRVRENVPLENYVYYREVLEEVTRGG